MRKNSSCLLLGLLCLMFVFIPGCAKNAGDRSLKTVTGSGVLVLGLDENFPPMGFRDENGEITGFDIDLASEVCKRMNVRLMPRPINWDEKEKELNEGRIDCIWNGLSVNPERGKDMNLSEAYMKNDLVFVVLNTSGIKMAEELKGKKVGVQRGSSAESVLEASEFGPEVGIVTSEDNPDLLNRLDGGMLDAVFLDSVFAYYFIAENEKEYYILPNVLATEDFAVGFRREDQALRDKVQEILSEMRADGTLSDISTKWFGSDVTTVK